jgi:hypothetical protein
VKRLATTLLDAGCRSNLGGVESYLLYSHTLTGSKELVHKYVSEVVSSLEYISSFPNVDPKERLEFFRSAALSFGKTALCLSGGATFGFYHFGIVKSLLDRGLLPSIISGTSAGSLIAALACVRTDAELSEILRRPEVLAKEISACDEGMIIMLARLVREGVLFDVGRWTKKLQWVRTFFFCVFWLVKNAWSHISSLSNISRFAWATPLLRVCS